MSPKDDSEKKPTVEIKDEVPEKDEEIVIEKEQPKQDVSEHLQKVQSRMEYQARQYEKDRKMLNAQIQELNQSIQSLRQSPSPDASAKSADMDEIDELATRDWKKAVRQLALEEARAELQRKQQEELERQKRFTVEQELEASKRRVAEKYPDIMEEGTEANQAYLDQINKHPEYLRNPYGPELAMYRMEEEMKASGRIPPSERQVVDAEVSKEVQRRTRIGASTLPAGRKSGDGKIVLTTAEKELCDQHGIAYDAYARNRELGGKGFKEGVSVQ